MTIPAPSPGLVIHYAYLWRHEHEDGREEGVKNRPAVIVTAVARDEGGKLLVAVSPITHRDPGPHRSIPIPPRVKAALGLDDERSWIVTDEINLFEWPGFDLVQIPGKPGTYVYGKLPERLFNQLLTALRTARPAGVRRS